MAKLLLNFLQCIYKQSLAVPTYHWEHFHFFRSSLQLRSERMSLIWFGEQITSITLGLQGQNCLPKRLLLPLSPFQGISVTASITNREKLKSVIALASSKAIHVLFLIWTLAPGGTEGWRTWDVPRLLLWWSKKCSKCFLYSLCHLY